MSNWPPAWLTPVDQKYIDLGDGEFAAEFAEAFGTIGRDGIAGRAGQALKLRPWQRRTLEHLYARDEDGGLIAQTALIGMPRKNGKSALSSAGVALYSLIAEGVEGGEVIVAAAEKEQARLVFSEAKRMVETSELSEMVQVYKDSIFVPETNSVMKVVSAEAYSKEGYNPHRVILDELHAHKTRDLFDVFSLAMGNRGKIAQLLAITTAGTKSDSTGRDSIAYTLYQYGQKVARGEVVDPSFFMAWWEAPADMDHHSPEAWKIANPGFDDLVAGTDFESAVRRTPEAEFRTKRLNQWVSSQQAWLPAGLWDSCEEAFEWSADDEYVLGFDGSFSNDSTAIVAVTIPKDDELPKVKLVKVWEKDFEKDDDSWRVNIADVEETILNWVRENPLVREIACDPFRWQRSMQALMESGLPIVEYNTGYLKHMIPATAKVFDAVVEKQLIHDGNPTLARHLDNCIIKSDAKGTRVTKEHNNSKRKIDAAIAFIIAFDRATRAGKIEEAVVPEFFSF
jgi:phage terminase large subunit-like protein